jgi:hypothetical protein
MIIPFRIVICFSFAATMCAPMRPAEAQTSVPPELQSYYDANQAEIKPLITTAENAGSPVEERARAFERLIVGYPRASLDTAIKLTGDENLGLAVGATTFLSSVVVMMNHGPTLDSHDAHGGDQSIAKAIASLRKAALDPRQPVREVAAASLTSLNDETTLKLIQSSYFEKKISDVEALQYITLSRPDLGADYVATFLDKSSVKAQSEAISYLSSNEQYRAKIKNYLFNEAAPVEIRAAAAKGLARNDPSFGTYAPSLVANSKLPSPVFNSLVSEMSGNLSTDVVKNVLSQAIQAKPDRYKFDTLMNSITRYESVRPELDTGSLQNSLRKLNPT